MNAIDRWTCVSLAAIGLALVVNAPAWAARNGDLDPDFGSQGKVALAFPGDLFLANVGLVGVALLPSGQMIVAGTVINAADNEDFAAIRINADGSLDTGYGLSGGRRVGFDRPGSSLNDFVQGLLVQPDGKAVLAGSAAGEQASGDYDMAVVRLTATGQLDASFGTGGRVVVPFNLGIVGSRDDHGAHVSRQADGKILVVGYAQGADGAHDMALVRLTANGQRDNSFDGDGRVTIDFGPDHVSAEGQQVRQLADGERIVVVGIAGPQLNGSDFALARLDADGSLDSTFGDEGKAVFDFAVGGNNSDFAFDFIELPDGKLLVCGYVEVNAPTNVDMGCMRFLEDGTPDPAFPAVLVPFDRGGSLIDIAAQIVRDDRGRIVLGGAAQRAADNADFALARLLPEGDLDAGFGNGGTLTHSSCTGPCVLPSERDNVASSVMLQPDGKIIVAGIAANSTGDYRFMVMRLFGDVIFSHGFEP